MRTASIQVGDYVTEGIVHDNKGNRVPVQGTVVMIQFRPHHNNQVTSVWLKTPEGPVVMVQDCYVDRVRRGHL